MTVLFLIFLGRGESVRRGECDEGGSVKRGECEEGEGGDSEWRDRFGRIDWFFLAFEFES